MVDDLALLTAGLERQSGASEETIVRIESQLGIRFPEDYRSYLRFSNGARGWIKNVYLELWRIEDVPTMMDAGQIRERVPGLIPFGGDGSRENLAFDSTLDPPPIVLADITCSSRADALFRAESFFDFLRVIRQTGSLFPSD